MSSTLFEIFDQHEGDEIYKWSHYFDIYEKHFSKFRNSKESITVIEIGVLYGGSLQMWQKYFGEKATIVGIDIYKECKKYEKDNIKIRIGSQSDKSFLKEIVTEFPKIDLVIDDGSHRVFHQLVSFKYLFPYLRDGGVYLIEDTHSSYWVSFGGGLKRRGSMIEFSISIIDSLHARYSEQRAFKQDYYTENVAGIHFYDSIICFNKGKTNVPITLKRGNNQENRENIYHDVKKSYVYKFSFFVILKINQFLQFFRLPGFILDGAINIKLRKKRNL